MQVYFDEPLLYDKVAFDNIYSKEICTEIIKAIPYDVYHIIINYLGYYYFNANDLRRIRYSWAIKKFVVYPGFLNWTRYIRFRDNSCLLTQDKLYHEGSIIRYGYNKYSRFLRELENLKEGPYVYYGCIDPDVSNHGPKISVTSRLAERIYEVLMKRPSSRKVKTLDSFEVRDSILFCTEYFRVPRFPCNHRILPAPAHWTIEQVYEFFSGSKLQSEIPGEEWN